ncbi:MAG: ACP S-malonyltransferase [Chromatiales bacterium]
MSIAFVFPGQGSQSVGMLREFAATEPVVEATFAEASDMLGYDLWRLVQNGDETELNMTEKTQPAMLAAGTSVWRLWRARRGTAPAVLAGHSLGEYTALVCAGALGFPDAVRLVAERGRCMQAAVPAGEGAMAAVLGLEQRTLEEMCARAAGGETVACANLNAPGQIVIAGHRAAVERVMAAAKVAGARRAVLLPVSVPSHCALMAGAAERVRPKLESVIWRTPAIPVLHNSDVTSHRERMAIIDSLARQLHQPVRWIDTIRRMREMGVATIIECGPGKILTGLCKRIEPDIECLAVFDPASLDAALEARASTL